MKQEQTGLTPQKLFEYVNKTAKKPKGYNKIPIELAVHAKIHRPTKKSNANFHADGVILFFWDDKEGNLQIQLTGRIPQFFIEYVNVLNVALSKMKEGFDAGASQSH